MIRRPSIWYRRSVEILDRAIAAVPPAADAPAIRRAVREAYPFGERKHWPYKKWLEARAQMLYLHWPKLFGRPRRRARELLPGERSLFEETGAAA